MVCRNCGTQVYPGQNNCAQCGTTIGSGSHYCPSCGAVTRPEDRVCSQCGVNLAAQAEGGQQQYTGQQQYNVPPQQPYNGQQAPYQPKSKMAAGLLGIFLGAWGIHNFYLGYTNKAILQLVLSLVCGISAIWGIIDGIMILTGSINVDAKGYPLVD